MSQRPTAMADTRLQAVAFASCPLPPTLEASIDLCQPSETTVLDDASRESTGCQDVSRLRSHACHLVLLVSACFSFRDFPTFSELDC